MLFASKGQEREKLAFVFIPTDRKIHNLMKGEKKDKYKLMIEVFNHQHIYVQSRHFHTEITKKVKKKKSKMHFLLI